MDRLQIEQIIKALTNLKGITDDIKASLGGSGTQYIDGSVSGRKYSHLVVVTDATFSTLTSNDTVNQLGSGKTNLSGISVPATFLIRPVGEGQYFTDVTVSARS